MSIWKQANYCGCTTMMMTNDDTLYWMTESRLKLNAHKTEFLITGTQKQRELIKNLFPDST